MVLKFKYVFATVVLTSLLTACSTYHEQNFAPVVTPELMRSNQIGVHVVEPGETLYAVAFRYNMDYRRLAALNDIDLTSYAITAGQRLRLTGRVYPRPIDAKPVNSLSRAGRMIAVASKPAVVETKSSPIKLAESSSVKQRPRPKLKITAKSNKLNTPLAFASNAKRRAWLWPLEGRIAHYFDPSRGRKGISVVAKPGDGIKAARGGRVAYAGNGLRGYGNLIIIKHDNEFLSAYAHNKKIFVKEGQPVLAGQVIAEVGRSINDQYQLHFEIRKEGEPVNPLKYLATS